MGRQQTQRSWDGSRAWTQLVLSSPFEVTTVKCGNFCWDGNLIFGALMCIDCNQEYWKFTKSNLEIYQYTADSHPIHSDIRSVRSLLPPNQGLHLLDLRKSRDHVGSGCASLHGMLRMALCSSSLRSLWLQGTPAVGGSP